MIEVNALVKLRDNKEQLTYAERKLAEYILQHPEEIPSYSISQLATLCGVSDATVLRLCKDLGFTGYRQFVVSVTSGVVGSKGEVMDTYAEIVPGDSVETIMRNVAGNNCRSIEDTLSVLDVQLVKQAVSYLHHAKKLAFFGLDLSNLVCLDMARRLTWLNYHCEAQMDVRMQYVAAAQLLPLDAAVIFSNSGRTEEMVKIANIVKRSGAKLIIVSRYQKSPLADLADVCLIYSTPQINNFSVVTGSLIAMLTIVDMLLYCLMSGDYDRVAALVKTRAEINHP